MEKIMETITFAVKDVSNGRKFGTSLDDPGLEILTDKIQFSDVFSQVRSLQYLAF